MKRLLILATLALGGCAMNGQLLSMKYCPKVSYQRNGNMAHIEMDCALPIEGAMPVNPGALLGL